MGISPELCLPDSKSASGILPAIRISDIFVIELLGSGDRKGTMINCDGASVNKAAIRMLTREMQKNPQLLVFSDIFDAHKMTNSLPWGVGGYSYGSVLRTAHVFGAIRDSRIPDLVRTCLRNATEPDPILESDAATEYFQATQSKYSAEKVRRSESDMERSRAPWMASDYWPTQVAVHRTKPIYRLGKVQKMESKNGRKKKKMRGR